MKIPSSLAANIKDNTINYAQEYIGNQFAYNDGIGYCYPPVDKIFDGPGNSRNTPIERTLRGTARLIIYKLNELKQFFYGAS